MSAMAGYGGGWRGFLGCEIGFVKRGVFGRLFDWLDGFGCWLGWNGVS
jgi:hypothetical protein